MSLAIHSWGKPKPPNVALSDRVRDLRSEETHGPMAHCKYRHIRTIVLTCWFIVFGALVLDVAVRIWRLLQ
jgi:hypothetical protein